MNQTGRDYIKEIANALGLPLPDPYSQDWAYELPEQYRTPEYFARYVEAYATPGYGDIEREILMELMLDVVNDLLIDDEATGLKAWERLVPLIRSNPDLHREQVEYWTLPESTLEDAFHLTPLARDLAAQLRTS